MRDQDVLRAIATHESNNDPNAVGKSGEIGKYQFMPATIKALGGDIRTLKGDSAKQDELALKHYSSLRAIYGDDQDKIIAAWNAGQGGVDKAVREGGADWQKRLPKGTNKFGAAYDTGAYLGKVKGYLPQDPQQQEQQTAQSQPTPETPSPGLAMTNESKIATTHVNSKKADVMKWLEDYVGQTQEQKPESPKQEQKPQEAGGFFNSVGSAFKTAGSALGSVGQAAADFIVPKNPVEGASLPRRMMEAGATTMVEGATGLPGAIGDLLAPSGEEAARRGALSPGQGAKELGGSLLGIATDAINATPLGGVMGAAGPAGHDLALATGDVSDEALKQRLADLEGQFDSPEGPGEVAAIKERVKGLLMMPYDERVKKLGEFGTTFAEVAAGVVPAPMFLGAGKMIGKAGGAFREAQNAAKLARQQAVIQAGEAAMAAKTQQMVAGTAASMAKPQTAEQIAANMKGAGQRGRAPGSEITGEQRDYMRLQMKRGSTPEADAKLMQLEADPAAKAAIDETFVENVPDMVVSAPGSARVQGTPAREQLRKENVRGFEDAELQQNMPERTAAEPAVEAAAPVAEGKPSPVARIVEDVNFEGASKRAVLGPNDNMVVALDKDGNDLGYLWYTREPGGGYTVRKIETAKNARRQGVAKALDEAVAKEEGPYKGATDQTPEGKAFRKSRGGEPKLQPAPENLYRDLRDLFQGDLDLTEAALVSRGFKMPELGLQENKTLHEVMGVAKGADEAEKMAAQDALIKTASDVGITPEAGVEALPSVAKIIKDVPAGDLKSIREIIADAIKNPEHPLSSLRALQGGANEAGKVNAAVLFAMTRATLGAVVGGMTGDDPYTAARNALLGAGLGSVLSPKLATRIGENLKNPEVLNALKDALTLHGEQGALRFPSRGVGRKPSPNTENMGVSVPAKRVVRGINEQLEKLDLLARSKVQTHEMTIEAARQSQYNTVEKVLSLDSAKLSPDELASAGLAARGVRDFAAEELITDAARAKLNPNDLTLAEDVMTRGALVSRLSQQVTNLETAYARATNALGIMTDTSMASKFDLKAFANDVEIYKNALMAEGKVSPTQFVEMINSVADKAAAAKIATIGSKWPAALWNIYYGLNLLASPLTHFRNIIGNTGALGMAIFDRAGGELLGHMYRVAGAKGATVAPGETYELFSGVLEMISNSFRAGSDKMGAFGYFEQARTTGKSAFGPGKYSEMLAAAEAANQAGNGTLPSVILAMSSLGQKNMAILTGTDEFFKVLSFHGELRSLAKRGSQHLTGDARKAEYLRLLENPTTDMLHGATAFAHENTFSKAFKENEGIKNLFGLGRQIETAANNPFAKVLATPFYRTPMRIGEFSTVHTPVLNLMAPQFYSDMFAGGVKQQLALSKIMTGTAMMGTFGYMAAHGYITGVAPSDPALRKKWEDAGWQEKSFFVPGLNKYISYDNIEPISTIVGTIATFIQAAPDMDDHSIQTIWSAGTLALAKNMLNKQWFSGLQDWSEAAQGMAQGEDATALIKLLSRRTATLIPGASAWRNIQNATDPVKRDTTTVTDNDSPELREFQKIVHIFSQNLPGWGGHNALELAGYKPRPAARNGITGEKVANENTWLGFVNPFRITSYKNDIVLNEIVGLDGAGLPQELIPRVLGGSQSGSPYKLQGVDEQRAIKEGIKLSGEERDRLGDLLTEEIRDHNGDTMHEAMARRIGEDDYADLKDGRDGGKAAEISRIYHEFLDEAGSRLREEYPRLDVAIQQRKILRDGNKLPKSMDWVTNDQLQMVNPR